MRYHHFNEFTRFMKAGKPLPAEGSPRYPYAREEQNFFIKLLALFIVEC
jgi:hypothetical protein